MHHLRHFSRPNFGLSYEPGLSLVKIAPTKRGVTYPFPRTIITRSLARRMAEENYEPEMEDMVPLTEFNQLKRQLEDVSQQLSSLKASQPSKPWVFTSPFTSPAAGGGTSMGSSQPKQPAPPGTPVSGTDSTTNDQKNKSALIFQSGFSSPPLSFNVPGATPPPAFPVYSTAPAIPADRQVPETKESEPIMNQKIQNLEKALKSLQGADAYGSTEFNKLCFFPDSQLPPKFKIPDFSKYNGTGDPMAHLKLYAGALSGYHTDDKMQMQLFQHSLAGAALQWFSRLPTQEIHTWQDLCTRFLNQYNYNCKLVHTRISLTRMNKRPEESFRDHAIRWREAAAQVNPPMIESEYVSLFVEACSGIYFDKFTGNASKNFHDLLLQGEQIEDALKSGRLKDAYAKTAESASGSNRKFVAKKAEGEVSMILPINNSPLPTPWPQNTFQPTNQMGNMFQRQTDRRNRAFTPLAISQTEAFQRMVAAGKITPIPARPPPNPLPRNFNQNAKCAYHSGQPGHSTDDCFSLRHKIQDMIDDKSISISPAPSNSLPNVDMNPLPNHNGINMIYDEASSIKPYELIGLPGTVVVYGKEISSQKGNGEYVIAMAGEVQPSHDPVPFTLPIITEFSQMSINPTSTPFSLPAYTSPTSPGYSADHFSLPILGKINQPPITNTHQVPWIYSATPLSSPELTEPVDEIGGMTRSGRCYTPEELERQRKGKGKAVEEKEPLFTEKDATEFFRVLKKSEYNIVEQLKKTPAHIDILSLLLTSSHHREALLSIFKEAHVPKDISPEDLQNMAGLIMSPNIISFSDDEIPAEGTGHTKALHIAVMTKGMVVARVLIDNGSALNVCPYQTLERLGLDHTSLRHSNITVRAFDGSTRETMGEIELPVEIGPVVFAINFQVLQIPSAYNFLLGRPWIHISGGVSSSLHQKVKFLINGRLTTVSAEEDFAIYKAPTVPFIESVEPSSFQTLECVTVMHGSPAEPTFAERSKAMASYFKRKGFQIHKGLGASLQGRTEQPDFVSQLHTFGLGFKPTRRQLQEWIQKRKGKKGKTMTQGYTHLPHIKKTFPTPPTVIVFEEMPSELAPLPQAVTRVHIEKSSTGQLQDKEDKDNIEVPSILAPLDTLADLFREEDTLMIDIPSTSINSQTNMERSIRAAYPGEKLANWSCKDVPMARRFR